MTKQDYSAADAFEVADPVQSAMYAIEDAMRHAQEAEERFLCYLLEMARHEALQSWRANDNRGEPGLAD